MRAKLWSEFFGTFTLVFCGTGAIVINDTTGGAVTHPGIALTFGLVVMAIIYTFGDISVANFNPAVKVAFAVAKRFEWRRVTPYIAAQLPGAVGASLLIKVVLPLRDSLGATAHKRRGDTILDSGNRSDLAADAGHSQRFNRRQGKGNYGRTRGWCHYRSGSNVRRTDLRRLDESSSLLRARSRFIPRA